MTKTKKYLPFPLFLLILGVVGITTWSIVKALVPTAQPIGINEITPSGRVTLSLNHNRVGMMSINQTVPTYYLNDDNSVHAYINTNTARVTGAVVEIAYDATSVEVTSVTNGGFLPVTLVPPVIANGKITFTFASSPDSGGVQGAGTLAKINIKPLKPGSTTFSFNEPTIVSVVDTSSNDLKSVVSYEIYIGIIGDINQDKKVDIFDYNLFVADYGTSSRPVFSRADLNKSGTVDIFDYNLFVADYGKTSP